MCSERRDARQGKQYSKDHHVYRYFERESQKCKLRGPPRLTHKTAEATGYGERTVRRIVAEMSLEGATFASPAKQYKADRKKIVVDDFDTEAIRRTVHDFDREKEYPKLDSLLVAVKEKGVFSGGRVTLWKLLRKIGFRHKKINNKRYIYEQPRIIVHRKRYLR